MPWLSARDLWESFREQTIDRLRNPPAILTCVVYVTTSPGLP